MWYCDNENCENHNVKIPIDEVVLLSPYYTEKQRIDYTRCSKCNQSMCREDEDNNNTVLISKFNSMSDEDKKNMLKKEHRNIMRNSTKRLSKGRKNRLSTT